MADALAATPACSSCELHAEAVFRVEGLDCHEEVVILERRLKPLPGVEALSADVIGQRLHVKYDAARLTTSAMVQAVGQTGMRMWLEHDEPTTSGGDLRARMRLLLASAGTTASGLGALAAGWPAASAVLLTAAAAVGSVYPVRRAFVALRTRTVDINVLMVVAVAGALMLGEWLEAATVVLLFAVAQWLEARTLERARGAIRALLDLSPRQALLRRGGVEVRVAVEDLRVGEEIIVRPGDKVAVDGVVAAGGSEVNEAPLTGESLPIDKGPGDPVYAGTINGRGSLDVRVTRVGRDTRLARITHLVEEAQAQRAPVQAFVDRFARVYTPVVIVLAALVAAVPPLVLGAEAGTWIYRGLTLLVIACPCALVISTPVSIVAALSAAARNGVLLKGGVYLERLAAVRVIAFDKTGTLTTGRLKVAGVHPAAGVTEGELLRRAAAVEQRSEHPIARAIVERASLTGEPVRTVSGFEAIAGLGASGDVDGHRVLVGNRRLLARHGIEVPASADGVPDGTRSRIHVAVAGRFAGSLTVADTARSTAREAIELARTHGIDRIVMLTGDEEPAARAVAGALGVDEWHSGLLPEEKHQIVAAIRETGRGVLMVGDGVNDAPALAAADVGVAMGAAGSDVAVETADVALMSDELLKLPYALRLARATVRNVKTNVAVSLVLKAAFLVMAVAGTATLWMAVLADTGASVIVVANALRLLREK
jgi:Cd2+/Zn2+-exporting ATPase